MLSEAKGFEQDRRYECMPLSVWTSLNCSSNNQLFFPLFWYTDEIFNRAWESETVCDIYHRKRATHRNRMRRIIKKSIDVVVGIKLSVNMFIEAFV